MNEQLFQKATELCQQRQIRFTPIRQKVFLLMLASPGAISAYDLLEQLQQTEKSAKPPTIYRALDFLLEQGFIHRIESDNTFILCPHFDSHHAMQLLICDHCGTVIELHNEAIDKTFNDTALSHGFLVNNKTIEAHGTCKDCQ
ncbi:zinc uptake transcriptional repressor Zur [Motilimonas pumila]|uniref:Ferric uptake regulation protein n=1 Tax=Motilimonas pumila TaxID=2303987 RepID=A0A418YF75_9GAMM|nr:zinc uptake transcriptional repressor Zur [Motilimonas pumila]RJG47911.1 transcriptional regulator Zur [Motilimonas pumila]